MNFFRKKPPLNQRSQIAVIITFVIAVTILFIVVFINITKVSQVKTTTSTSADKAALSLASQLGSMSHYYKDKVLNGKTLADGKPGECETDLGQLIDIPSLYFQSFILSPLVSPAGTSGMSFLNTMFGGISEKINKEMSSYNGWREKTLFDTLRDIETDDLWFKSKGKGTGIFLDAQGNEYDLSAIPEMLNQPRVDRFSAWYYRKRYPLVSEKGLRGAINNFVNKLKGVVMTEKWDPKKWMITGFALKVAMDKGQITSTSPYWVIDANSVRAIKFDESGNTTGFLIDKFSSLLDRLEERGYKVSFYNRANWKNLWNLFSGGTELENVIEDLKMSLTRATEVFNLPVSLRVQGVTEWFPKFYDLNIHNSDGSSINGNFKDGRDIFERLRRAKDKLNDWLNELSPTNSDSILKKIKDDVEDAHKTHCQEGRGNIAAYCMKHAGPGCLPCYPGNETPAHWYGIYGTCTGRSNHKAHPVCIKGDLYGKSPDWCNFLKEAPQCTYFGPCPSACPAPDPVTAIDKSYHFQGQLSWRPPSSDYFDSISAPTEVEQATQVLGKLIFTITQLQDAIKELADVYARFLKKDDPLRNELTYAWLDKPKSNGGQQFYHLAHVAILDYPKDLPYISEARKWFELKKCRTLKAYEGNFQIKVSRYDQDQPTDIGKTDKGGWQLRRRKYGLFPGGEEFPPGYLANIVEDVQDNGKIDTYEEYVKSILYNFAITSCSSAHYGPEKSDIYIKDTKCN